MSQRLAGPMTLKTDFEKAGDKQSPHLGREFVQFLAHNKKWWLLPIGLVLLALSALAFFATTGAAPFIYTLF